MSQKPLADPSQDLFRIASGGLESLLAPKTVAVIGATEAAGSVGRTLLWNLVTHPFGGIVFPVNPNRASVLGIRAYPNVAAIGEPIDLAVIATKAATVPNVVSECVAAGVKSAVIISAGFREMGPAGAELERQIFTAAQHGKMRLVGPNCLGVMNPLTGLNATFAGSMALPGNVAFVSQSGALCTAILDWSIREMVGFSAFISIGSMVDVDWGDLIQHFGDDPRTHSILLYMESIGDARSFLSAAREVALSKPIIVLKAGRTQEAALAATSHTGSLASSDAVVEAAFRRTGILRVERVADLFQMADILAKQPRPKGPRLSIVTNAGGPGVLATDALLGAGGKLAELSIATHQALDAVLPPHWSRGNPIDILGDADPDRFAKAIEIASSSTDCDGLLVILTPQDMTDPTRTAETIKAFAHTPNRPILASWMGGPNVAMGRDILNRAGIPTFDYPDAAARAFTYMWRHSYNLRGLYETPSLASDLADEAAPDRTTVQAIIADVRSAGRTLLTESESKRILAAYGIPTISTLEAKSADDAVGRADELGYPVALKLLSPTITHKTDVGGVRLGLATADAVREAFAGIQAAVADKDFEGVTVQKMAVRDGLELIIGSTVDPQFGPVLLFGTGGQFVEIYKDRSLGLPPLNATLARRMMEQTNIFRAFGGVRGKKPINLNALEKVMVRFSRLVEEQPWIKESDINPLLASADGVVALDARFVLFDPSSTALPKPAVRPYPSKYVLQRQLRDGTPITIRPIRPDDEPRIVKFHETLSDQSVRFRYFNAMKLSSRTAHERLIRVCFIDYDREIALVADRKNPETGDHEILGVVRLSKLRGGQEAEFAMIVSDRVKNQGLGTQLIEQIVQVARDEQLVRLTADILLENGAMQHLAKKVGFNLTRSPDPSVVRAELVFGSHSAL